MPIPTGMPAIGTEWCSARDSETKRREFWLRVEMGSADECWPWHGSSGKRGYGFISLGTKASISAHRYSYFVKHGHLPADKLIRHSCDNPRCVNPNHLEAGTHLDNSRDFFSRGHQRRRLRSKKAMAS